MGRYSKEHTRTPSRMLFEESIKSKYTKKNYDVHLKQFRMFSGLSSNEEILNLAHEKIQTLLEDYLLYLKKEANPNSIPSRFQGIRHLCVMNRIHLDWDIIRKMFPQRKKRPTLRAYTSSEIQTMLTHAKGFRNVALIHFLASTGARIGVFDYDMTVTNTKKMPDMCMGVKLYAGEIEEYWGFLTPQASRALNSYYKHRQKLGEVFDEDTPIFTAEGPGAKPLRLNGARSIVYRIVSKCITRHKHGSRYDVQVDHGFRKRFNTILKLDNSINSNIAEKLMGHKNGLDDVYLVPTLEDMFKEFKKAIRKIEV